MRHVPYGPPGGSLFGVRHLKSSPGLSFNFPIPVEDEVGESDSDKEDGLGVSSTVPSSAFLPGDPVGEVAQAPASDT